MLGRKKGFTASQSKRMSRRMANSTIGTHVSRRPRVQGCRHNMNAQAVGFSSSRKKRRAARGIVETLIPQTSSGESSRAYSQRVGQRQYAQQMQRKSSGRRVVVGVLSVLIVAAVAVGVGVAVFFGASDSKLSLGSSNASGALAAAKEGEPYYVLCAAQLGAAQGSGGASTEGYLLVRVDEQNRALTFVSIPGNLQVSLSDGKKHPLYDTENLGGDAALVQAVASFAGVDISHFVRTDAEGISGLVDIAGNVGVTLSEEVDDPAAGDAYLAAGSQALDAEGAITLLRASNFSGGVSTQADNRIMFTKALAQRLLEIDGIEFASLLDRVADCLSTDLSSQQIMALAQELRPFGQVSVYGTSVPGSTVSQSDGTVVFQSSSARWDAVMQSVSAGQDPAQTSQVDTSGVDPAAVKVEVRNGGGAAGVAASVGNILSQAGYAVDKVGNVDDATTYPETLVIYKDSSFETAAQAVVSALGAGRVVNGGDYYTFETDVLVIVGVDWMPVE